MTWKVKLGQEGRVIVPREFRKSKGINHNDKLVWILSEDQEYLKLKLSTEKE